MVFAIRRLILRSRIRNSHLSYRLTPLHISKASISTSPRIWQQRSFSALSRYNQESGDNGEKKATPVNDVREQNKHESPAKVEPSSAKSEEHAEEANSLSTENVVDQSVNDGTLKEPTNPTHEAPKQSSLSDETKAEINVQPESETRANVLDQAVHEMTLEDTTKKPGNEALNAEVMGDMESSDNPPSSQDEAEIQKWKQEIGLTDEELSYYLESYPGIDAELITAVKKGQLSESDLIDAMQEGVEEQEQELSPEEQAELKKMTPSLEAMGEGLYGGGAEDEFSEQKLQMLGLSQEDMEALNSGDPNNIDGPRLQRLQKAMRTLGLSEKEIQDMTRTDADDMEGEQGMEEFQRSMGGLNRGRNEDGDPMRQMAEEESEQDEDDDGEELSQAEIDQFLNEYGASGFPPHLKETFSKALKGDNTAMDQMLQTLSQEERDELDNMTQSDSERMIRNGLGGVGGEPASFEPQKPGSKKSNDDSGFQAAMDEQVRKITDQYKSDPEYEGVLGKDDTEHGKRDEGEDDPEIASEIRELEKEIKQDELTGMEPDIPEDEDVDLDEDEEDDDDDEDEEEERGFERDFDEESGEAEIQAANKELENSPEYRQMMNNLEAQTSKLASSAAGNQIMDSMKDLATDQAKGGDKSFEMFMQQLEREGITPDNMGEEELTKALDSKLQQPSFTKTADGDVVRVHNVGSKEELDSVRSGINEDALFDGPSGMDGMPLRGPREAETAEEMQELMEQPGSALEQALREADEGEERMPGESNMDFSLRKMGLKSDEEIREERKDRKEDPGFFNYGEENEDVGEDEDFQGDDLPSAGHGEVDQHRELREYARLAAWELPMLHKLAQPFEPPDKTTPLRFRYTTYMGEQHPASRKVVLEFSPSELPDLSPLQTAKLIKLAGPRYNPSLNLIKMSCESFETQAQNKRYLGDLVYKLLKTAKDASTDNFEDVPADFRHHKPKPFHVFPERWKLTPERRKVLEEKRVKELQDEEAKRKDGSLVDGASVISEALNRLGMREMLEKREREKLGSGNAAARPGRGRVTGGAGGAKRF